MNLLFVAAFLALGQTAVPAPVTGVTVYSDRARVTRTAQVTLSGVERVELPLLLDTVDPATIVVEADGAEVRRVDVEHVDAEDFPRVEARELLSQIEKLDDELARVRGDRSAQLAMLRALAQLKPEPSTEDAMRPVPKLNPAGWPQVLEFVDTFGERLQARVRELDEKLIDLAHERTALGERARLVGGAARHAGYRVSPTLQGKGAARVTVSYLVANARWYPTYDLQLVPEKGQVRVSFAGQVSQESGEDWTDARLTLSTAVPATSTRFPKLFTWKIGERERFVPTPTAPVPTMRPPPAAAPLSALPSGEREDESLRRRLAAYASVSVIVTSAPDSGTVTLDGKAGGDRDGDGIPDVEDKNVDETQSRVAELERQTESLKQQVMRSKARIVLSKETVLGGQVAAAPPPSMPAPPPAQRSIQLDSSAEETVVLAERAPASPGYSYRSEPPPVTVAVGLAPPSGWQAPSYAPNLPVSLAGGYDLAFPSLRPESIKSGDGARRVALFSEAWPVTAERRVFPALAPEAFLVAEIKNPSSRVLPGGPANLFVGADPAGTAALKVVAPGETVTLPLGLDRAIKPIRNVKLDSWEKGVFSKDDISQYTVTMEVANPYKAPLKLRVTDQWPTTTDKNVEIKLLRADGAEQNREKATLVWNLTLPPSGKGVVSFTYSVKRPKGWRLHQ
ncbi:MAG TPA: mucoidy inhibitor MuiA family protein [Polyangia bacterium]|nr:mucoidy inhibitor MuiA family protein [Polyangia bacterium]